MAAGVIPASRLTAQKARIALMALLGALMAIYAAAVAKAYQIAPPAIIGTFDYAYLISAAIWGFVFFSETPDALTLAGMALITAAGLLVAAPARAGAGRSSSIARLP